MSSDDLWQACLDHLSQHLPQQQFRTWAEPLALGRTEEQADLTRIVIYAPNRFKQSWAKDNLNQLLHTWFQQALNTPVDLTFEVQTNPAEPESGVSPAHSSDRHPGLTNQTQEARPSSSNGHADADGLSLEDGLVNAPQRQPSPAQSKAKLRPDWTFDQFVAGKANQLARAAALQVANNPGQGYNPLFLYGGVGLGKSHLIHAVGNQILQSNPAAKIRYTHAEAYVSDVVRAYQRKSFEDLKTNYHSLDLLLIDDIQFFSGKNRSQEELFYTFEALIQNQKQLILTSDTYPTELNGIDQRLISRFGQGLTVAIEPPELEMRVAILLRKADQENFALAEEEAFFIAQQLRSNVRELEGALQRVIAFCHFHQRQPSIDVVREALKDLLSLQKTANSVETIQRIVADHYKIKIGDMYSKRKPANIALPRQIAMYLAKELTQKSYPEIGELFGGRDHTTVLHAVKKITELRQNNADLNRQLHILDQLIRG